MLGACIKLGDFGLSRKLDVDRLATSSCGTPMYMAPEVVAREAYSFACDHWSLGCTLFEMLTLRRAFDVDGLPALALAIAEASYDSATLERAPYSDALKQLASRSALLHPQPERRTNLPLLFSTLTLLLADRDDDGSSTRSDSVSGGSDPEDGRSGGSGDSCGGGVEQSSVAGLLAAAAAVRDAMSDDVVAEVQVGMHRRPRACDTEDGVPYDRA
jgi:serine/threonine protein kinase